jgi:hypothetical protein
MATAIKPFCSSAVAGKVSNWIALLMLYSFYGKTAFAAHQLFG